jgi:hypothetical protein
MNVHVSDTNEANAVEVAALLGDSVVGVKHCLDPNSGRISRATWTLVATGAVALLASAIAFVVSVSTAAANQRALATWTHIQHRPASAFRPELLSFAWDWLAFGGLALGIAAIAYALVRVRDERRSPYYRIGTAPGVEQPCEGAPSSSFPLVAPAGNSFVFQFAPGMRAELLDEYAPKPLALEELARSGRAVPSLTFPGAYALPIPARGRIRAHAGQTTFLVTAMPRPRRQAVPGFSLLEGRAAKYLAGSLAAHLAIWALLQMVPVEGGTGQVDLFSLEDTTLRSATTQQDDMVKPPDPKNGADGNDGGAPATAAMKMEEGAAGSKTSTTPQTHLQAIHHLDADRQYSRTQAVEDARNAGFLGDASLIGGVAAIASETDFSNGFETQDVMGPMYGPDGPVGSGGFGTGRNGWGPGGGGWGTVGAGGYGVICGDDTSHCGRGVSGYGLGTGVGPGTGHRHPKVPEVSISQGTSVGDLDKAIIRRYIKRNVDKIAYCYERELLAKPDLSGTISVQFFIQPDGTVREANASGFDAEVGNCVAGVVKAIAFPRPNGGGGVQVNYPFVFHKADR